MLRDLPEEPGQGVRGRIMPSKEKSTILGSEQSLKAARSFPKVKSVRYLVNDLIVRHLALGIFRRICAQEHAHHVLPITSYHALLDQTLRKTPHVIRI